MKVTQPKTTVSFQDYNWLKQETIKQGEEIATINARLDKKHENILEIRQDEAEKRKRDEYFIENMSKISAVLDRLNRDVSDNKKNIDSLQKELNFVNTISKSIDSLQLDIKQLQEDVDCLKQESNSHAGATGAVKYFIYLLFALIGFMISYGLRIGY